MNGINRKLIADKYDDLIYIRHSLCFILSCFTDSYLCQDIAVKNNSSFLTLGEKTDVCGSRLNISDLFFPPHKLGRCLPALRDKGSEATPT